MFRQYKKLNGFTLIELTVLIALGAVLFTGIAKASMAMSEMLQTNRDYLIALNLANRQMAVMNNSAHPAVAVETALSADAAFPNFIPTQEVADVAVSGSLELRRVTIRVRIGSVSGPVLIRLDTYRTDLVTFGDGT